MPPPHMNPKTPPGVSKTDREKHPGIWEYYDERICTVLANLIPVSFCQYANSASVLLVVARGNCYVSRPSNFLFVWYEKLSSEKKSSVEKKCEFLSFDPYLGIFSSDQEVSIARCNLHSVRNKNFFYPMVIGGKLVEREEKICGGLTASFSVLKVACRSPLVLSKS